MKLISNREQENYYKNSSVDTFVLSLILLLFSFLLSRSLSPLILFILVGIGFKTVECTTKCVNDDDMHLLIPLSDIRHSIIHVPYVPFSCVYA